MPRAVVIRLAILVVLLAWPAFFTWLSAADEGHRWVWLTLHRVYYLPFSWVGPPLFEWDSETGLSVHPTGRAFAVFVYALLFYAIVRVVDRGKLASVHGKRKSDESDD